LDISAKVKSNGQANMLNPLPAPQVRICRTNTNSLLLSDNINMKDVMEGRDDKHLVIIKDWEN